MKKYIFVIVLLPILSTSIFCQVNKPKTSYELSNSPQWLKIPGGFASFAQFDYNNDGLDDVMQFQGYDLSVPYAWPGPAFFKNSQRGLIEEKIQLNNKKLFAGKTLVSDFNGDGRLDAFLLTGMDPAGCVNCPDPVFPLYSMLNLDGKSFKVDSIGFYGVWRSGTSGDIDNDGDVDVLTFSTHHQVAKGIYNRTLLNDGKGNFSNKPSNLDTIGWVDRVELIDMNKDNFLDLVLNDVYSPTNNYANRFRILWNDGKGNFNQNNGVSISIPNDLYVLDINAHDIDKDGINEVILPMNDAKANWSIKVFKSTDLKNFSDFTNQLMENATFLNSAIWDEPISVFDLDNNGKVDIVVNDRNLNLRWEWNGLKMVRNNCHNAIKPILNTSKFTFCSSDTLRLTVINNVKKDKYTWYVGNQVDSSNVITKRFVNSSKVFVVKTDSLGCETKSDEMVLTKLDTPKAPTITREGNTTLISSALAGNQWYLNGTILKGEIGQKINASVNGLYSVKYTDSNGCISEISLSQYGLITAMQLTDNKVALSPNPFDQSIKVTFPDDFGLLVKAEIHDVKGVIVWKKESVRNSEILDLSSLSVGNYVINLTSLINGQVSLLKISKQR
ncbi:FG-GAP repeat domain-containing protein [Aquirufa sp.]|jgi:hypothetical protein|uniref:FG-GAP repeat domain-containing protein n=1 Tax=Aquirufa sp. TaxID=2676249 RepID=UPI0037BF4A68